MTAADGWIENSGRDDEKPVAPGYSYRLRFRNGEEIRSGSETKWRWDHNGHTHDIVAFKIIH